MSINSKDIKKSPSQNIADLFLKYRSKEFIFVEPGGNYGDQLIYMGADKVAEGLGIVFERASFEEFYKRQCESEKVIYIHGGGGFVPWWSGKSIQLLKNAISTHKGIVILGPTTFDLNEDYAKNIFEEVFENRKAQEVYIFAREERSFGLLEKIIGNQCFIGLDHDTALNLVILDFDMPNKRNRYDLYAIRNDIEKNKAVPYQYLSFWVDPVNVASDFNDWVALHAKATRIITNRTHSALLGSILQIPTTILPNCYHKNRSIWEFSLRKRGVSWRDSLRTGSLNQMIEKNTYLKRVLMSSFYRRQAKRVLMNL